MKKQIFALLYWYFTFKFCPFFVEISVSPNSFYKLFIFGFLINYFCFGKYNTSEANFDLFIKYIILFLKSFKNFILFIITKVLKMFYYTIFFFLDICTVLYTLISDYTSKKFIIWRPLFKKYSYFGYFRNFRNKWFK